MQIKFLAKKVDKKFWQIAEKYQENGIIPMKFMKRFLDDLFSIFLCSIVKLHAFFEEINQIHPTIKFTMAHTTPKNELMKPPVCQCPQLEAIPFLDTLCQIKNGKISCVRRIDIFVLYFLCL